MNKKTKKTHKQINKKDSSSIPTPSQDLVCSFLYRENKKSSRLMQTGRQNSQLGYETASCPANVTQQNIQAYVQTSALKHHLNRPEQNGRTAVACLPLSQKHYKDQVKLCAL